MEMWHETKTDWKPTDCIDYSNYNRIKGNIQYLMDLTTELYEDFDKQPLSANKQNKSFYYPVDFNSIENNLEAINSTIFTQNIGDKKTFYENAPFIDNVELNRIETACQKIYYLLIGQKENIPRLSFRLGNYRGGF